MCAGPSRKEFFSSCVKPRCLCSIQLSWPLTHSPHALLWEMSVITSSGNAEALLSRSKLETLPSWSPWPPQGRICSLFSFLTHPPTTSRERGMKRRQMESSSHDQLFQCIGTRQKYTRVCGFLIRHDPREQPREPRVETTTQLSRRCLLW